MKISACTIVKNEARNIKKSIESYRDAVDEIIIADTGSTDNTVEICRSLGAKVVHFEWCNDFSAAKNFALGHATGDWIIFLDADEWFVPKLKRSFLLNLLSKVHPREDVVATTMCEYNPSDGKVRQKAQVSRIFRNLPEISYEGSIHEDISHSGGNMFFHRRLDVEIYHSGYSPEVIDAKTKRNIGILYDIYKEGKNLNTGLYFYLFRENTYLGNVEEAVKFYQIFMQQADSDRVIEETTAIICVYEEMYILMSNNRDRFTQEEIDRHLEEACRKYPFLPMHRYLLGMERLRFKDYQGSYDCIAKAIELNKEYSRPYLNKFSSVLSDAYYKLGHIRHEQGRTAEALENYLQAVNLSNDRELVLVLQQMVSIIEDQPQEEIILFLNSVIDMSKKVNVENILKVLKRTRLHKVFVYFALKYNRDFDEQDETTYIAMILSGQAGLAIETAIEASNNLKLRDDNTEGSLERPKEDNMSSFRLQESSQNINFIDFKEKGVSSNWHLDYAALGILYSKNINLYKKYQSQFNLEQKAIMMAYFEGTKIEVSSQALMQEYSRMINLTCYIMEEKDLQLLRSVVEP